MIGAIIAKRNVKAGLEALNRRDVSKFMSAWADDAVWMTAIACSTAASRSSPSKAGGWSRGETSSSPWMIRSGEDGEARIGRKGGRVTRRQVPSS